MSQCSLEFKLKSGLKLFQTVVARQGLKALMGMTRRQKVEKAKMDAMTRSA